ncbi:NADPH-dependent 7-cyano-7-deazaguanine reductase QueF [Aliiglaciecola litoralis]|uniref:NADPH-dependent 7-cyano-7-deazaguanine reductase n=1 Tax=Aliiglaciecola litoralis TaxID=582857 RepID=A0ABP3WUM8_9ALTE
MTKDSNTPSGKDTDISYLTLGKSVQYVSQYAPELLQGVPRSLSRNEIGLTGPLPFHGEDLWTAYELSWLNPKGKPQVAIMHCRVPFDTPNLIESKSFKLYLNSFNQTKIESSDKLQQLIEQDLSACAGGRVSIDIVMPERFNQQQIAELPGQCIDHVDVEINDYQLDPESLATPTTPDSAATVVEETLYSNLLKSNCLITNQPDWGSVSIHYVGPKIDQQRLLKYLISFRMHNEFHEQCAERIFNDIKRYCHPEKLSVYARYTRRGGLDINPFRSDFENSYPQARQARQ